MKDFSPETNPKQNRVFPITQILQMFVLPRERCIQGSDQLSKATLLMLLMLLMLQPKLCCCSTHWVSKRQDHSEEGKNGEKKNSRDQ